MTREEWDKLTPDKQWKKYLSLVEDVDTLQSELNWIEETRDN